MSAMQAEVFRAFRSAGVAEDAAASAAEALARPSTEFVVLTAKVDGVATDVATLKTDNVVMKWMIGAVLALLVALLVKAYR